MQRLRLLWPVLAMVIAVPLVSCGRSIIDCRSVPASLLSRSHPAWKGLRIHSARMSEGIPSSLIEKTGISAWEFDVDQPDRNEFVDFAIQVRRDGKIKRLLGIPTGSRPGIIGYGRPKHIAMVAYPLGKSWFTAETIRCAYSIDDMVSSTGEFGNPFRGMRTSLRFGTTVDPDGSFCLVVGNLDGGTSNTSFNEVALEAKLSKVKE